MRVKLVAYGVAKDILNANKLDYELKSGNSISQLKSHLNQTYPDFEKLRSLRFAVNEEYKTDDYTLNEDDEVVIIPPVSGG